jgi:hypothetical protein
MAGFEEQPETRGKFQPEMQRITGSFQSLFASFDYERVDEVAITSGVDPTVRFIGAPISVMKPLFLEKRVPQPGAFMVQNCVRTSNIQKLFEFETTPVYGSFFTAMGALVPYERLTGIFSETNTFLTDSVGIDADNLYISLHEADDDLHAAALRAGTIRVQPNTMHDGYYRHGYGEDGVRGRNISYWLQNTSTGQYEDVGNIIVIESDEGELGVELALGDTTLIKQAEGLAHILDAYDIKMVPPNTPEPLKRRFEDVVITAMALCREDIRPGSHNNQTRILRTYMKAASLYRRLAQLGVTDMFDRLSRLEVGVLPFNAVGVSEQFVNWVQRYEHALETKGPSNKEDHIIVSLIGQCAIRGRVES